MSFQFLKEKKIKKKRIVLLGKSGIISKNLQNQLKKKKIKICSLRKIFNRFKQKKKFKDIEKKN